MADPSTLAAWGLPGLFLAALLAGSFVPAPSEAVLAALVLGGVSPVLAVSVATIGNVLGASTLFALGRYAGRGGAGRVGAWVERRRREAGPSYERAAARLRRWGPPALALSWLPIAGDVLVLAAGLVGSPPALCLLFVTLGKALRYAVVAASVAP